MFWKFRQQKGELWIAQEWINCQLNFSGVTQKKSNTIPWIKSNQNDKVSKTATIWQVFCQNLVTIITFSWKKLLLGLKKVGWKQNNTSLSFGINQNFLKNIYQCFLAYDFMELLLTTLWLTPLQLTTLWLMTLQLITLWFMTYCLLLMGNDNCIDCFSQQNCNFFCEKQLQTCNFWGIFWHFKAKARTLRGKETETER